MPYEFRNGIKKKIQRMKISQNIIKNVYTNRVLCMKSFINI